ncbi:MAG: hypothetical protein ACK4QP_01255 [Pseudorhizobium sp.]
MISSLTTVRLWSQQAALNAFKEASEGRGSATSASGMANQSLSDFLSIGTDDAKEDTGLSALIASLQRQAMMGGASSVVPDASEGSQDDMSSKAFMRTVQEKLESLKKNPDTSVMADSMLKALKAGTLSITDTVAGEQIKAWDVSDKTQKPTQQAAVEKDNWTAFLKEHLERESNGTYVRNPDSSHKEKGTGASGYFGMIGERYYYLSWTTAAPAASGSQA